MDARDLKGMAVVTLAEAERVGRVDDVLFETTPLRAAALLMRDGNQERVIGFDAIRKIGPDAIVTDDVATAQGAERRDRDRDLPGLDALHRRKVVDETGTYLGQIVRVEVDDATGDVNAIDVRRGDVLGVGGETTTVERDDVVAVGEELMTVRHGAAPPAETTGTTTETTAQTRVE